MKLLMTLALSVLLLGNAFAQSTKGQSPTPAGRAAHATERMTKQLELNAQQVDQVNAMYVKYAEQLDDRQAGEATGNRGHEKEKLTARMDADLKAILTPEQYGKWMELQKGHEKRTEDGREIQEVESTD